jgi:hypothetical protein
MNVPRLDCVRVFDGAPSVCSDARIEWRDGLIHGNSLRNLELGGLLPGIKINTSATDFAPISQVQMMRFKGETWERFGDIIDGDVGG